MDDFDGYVILAWPRLLRSAWLLTGAWHRAADLAQTVLARAHHRWERIDSGVEAIPDAHLRAMLATTYLRGRRRDGAEDVEAGGSLIAALAALPRQQRAVIMLRFHADLTVTETARVLGLGEGTVTSYTAAGMRHSYAAAGTRYGRRRHAGAGQRRGSPPGGYQHLGDLLDDSVPPPPTSWAAAPLEEIHRRARRRRTGARVAAVLAGTCALATLVGLGVTAYLLARR